MVKLSHQGACPSCREESLASRKYRLSCRKELLVIDTSEPARVNRTLKKSRSLVGIKRHIRVHDLRHTTASMAFVKGIPGKVVQEMLGHSHYSTTMDIYSHVDQGFHVEASQKMNAVLGGYK